MPDDDLYASDVCCPACGNIMDAYSLFVEEGTGAGRMMMHMLGAFAEFERGIIRERSMAGQRAAMERGVHVGRKRSLPSDVESDIVKLYSSPGNWYTLDSLADLFEVHPSTVKRAVYRVLKPGHSSLR
jgi:DNA invertase Pin-like site-specific DNA recombinase